MLSVLECKRAECLEEIAECEKDLELARLKLAWLDDLIADVKEDAAEMVPNRTVAMLP